MAKQNKLLSIGDISKLTGASIKALRYYDRIKLLEPAYIDPHSKYRYYTFDQMYLVNIITFCVELDIPLKELTKFIDENKIIDASALLAYGKEIAEKKMRKFQQGLRIVAHAEQQIALSKKHRMGEIYSVEIPEKFFYIVPLEQPFDKLDWTEMINSFLNLGYNDEDYEDSAESGLLCEYSSAGIQRYVFIELPKGKPRGNYKTIPGGTYFCAHSNESRIENASDVFEEHVKGSFLAIETEIFTEKYEVNKPISELRVIGLD
ncbi:MAG: MerR family DNA-binding transcriptional regulator [Oscillospiraceae bacterium]|nr:MerR family DNA-binding transcriptional regulator [Oscillospiraceae bacterium]